jgi:CheY-like chemotaxis protein
MSQHQAIAVTTYTPLRILIVEDEALLAMELEALLSEAGHEVVGWATSAAEALQLATTKRPDLAFVDLQLSDGNFGIELAVRMHDIAGCAAVFITANTAVLPADYGGAVGVIAKPYSVSGLLSVLRYLHEGLRRPPPLTELPSSLQLSPHYLQFWATTSA